MVGYDVVVIGAGFAGLAAARELVKHGHEVLVLEGRDRVGGRSSTASLAGVPVDLGGTFVGPTQDAVIGLAEELGCPTEPTYNQGANLIRWRGKVRSYRGTIPRLGLLQLVDIARIQWQVERLGRNVDISTPWTSPSAKKLDGTTLGGWLHSVGASASSRDLLAVMSRVTWGAEPDQVSMLHAVRYVKAAGGLDRMLDVVGGAQQDHFPGGTQQIAEAMAAELGDRVRLNAIATRIEWSDDAVAVTSSAGVVEARRVIVAIPPAHRLNIDVAPPPPIGYQQLAQSWPQGALSKAYAAYPRPFWRDKDLSGQALSDEGPVFITFDVSPGDDGPGILLGFADSRGFDALGPEERRKQALACFSALFGPDAENPIDYLDHCWGAETFAPGGPTAAVPPGAWTEFGHLLRVPVGPLHWAGTETADEWTGFLDGAVRSGRRAAAEVVAALRS
ncbi:flavin monoamine oxidase family protein [Mycobacterium sp. ELW1]|uniref:flavin monoamine oxidase family protein n=1 Tax=Mycobacterium sp. ELW1 TaxID=1547487 RepID=UPI0011EC7241|nr:flavin monoamine oxidase family protein [Mycobacterium sp. ELW1]QEN15452.1 flavin monoamine oxidase family protein [Mycobacterium sp. ELW1]